MTASEPASGLVPAHSVSLSTLLLSFAHQFTGERVSIRDIKNSLGRRSFALIIFVLAIPNSLPVVGIPGFSTITGMPMLLIAFQMMIGQERIWLPKWITHREFSRKGFLNLIEKSMPWLARVEKLLKPRWLWLAKGNVERVLAAICFLMAFLLVLPIPFGNLLPGLSLLFISLGLLERDGVTVFLGLIISVMSLFYLRGLVWVAFETINKLFGFN